MLVIIATQNLHKIVEIEAGLKPLKWEFKSLKPYLPLVEPEENGDSFMANAEIKAKYYAEKTGQTCLADDSGLCVSSLGGAPGVYSSRYAGEKASDEDNLNKLLHDMASLDDPSREAWFETAMALYDPKEQQFIRASGKVYGDILDEAVGDKGFGYDPVFLPIGENKTFAQMDQTEKNSMSHRMRALKGLLKVLDENG